MRISIILLLFITICAASFSPRKSADKRIPSTNNAEKNQDKPAKTIKVQEEDSDEDVPTMDLSDVEEDAGVIERTNKKKKKTKPYSSSQKEKKDLQKEIRDEEEADYDDSQYEACNEDELGTHSDEQLCHCDMHEVDCSSTVLDSDNPHLRTANLKIMKSKFIAYSANFSDNGIERLQENKILPGFESTIAVLDFSHNGIRFIDGNAFAPFKNLTKLNLGNNNLQQLKKKWLSPMGKTLHRLDLSNNKLKSLAEGVFEEMKSLKKLILDGNPIREWKKEYFKGLDSLEQLSLDDCKIESLPGDIFEYLPNLTGVSLRSNPIDEIPRAVSNTQKLAALDLSDTNIAEIHSNAFSGDVVLEDIFLEDMKYLTVIRDCAFCGLSKLKELSLSNNQKLMEIHPNAFGFLNSDPGKKASSLTELNLSNSNISTLSEYMIDYDKLEVFRIGDNPWNCTCETVFLMDSKLFTYTHDRSFPKCSYPQELQNRSLAALHGYEACESIRSSHRSNRTTTVLFLSLLVCFIAIGSYHVVSSGKLSRIMRRVQNVPEVTYSNLTGAEENLNLETDFQPRPAEV